MHPSLFTGLVTGSVVGGSALVVVSARAWLRLKSYRTAETAATEAFSLDRYQPMLRLLSREDLDFLKSLPGVKPEDVKHLRSQRLKVFRTYLSELVCDFRQIHKKARAMVSYAPEEYADLVGVVMRQEMRFWKALAGVELHLALHELGVGEVSVAGLLEPLKDLQMALSQASERGSVAFS